jgi:hypothetical protein
MHFQVEHLHSVRQHTSAFVGIRQHTSAYVGIRQHTSAYIGIRQHTSACEVAPAVAMHFQAEHLGSIR